MKLVVVAVVCAGLLTQVSSAPASGSKVDRCDLFAHQSQVREREVSGRGNPVAVLGDSYSAGFGLASVADDWTSALSARVQVFAFSGSGFSRGASPCASIAFDQRVAAALATRPSLVVIEGGLNDFDQPTAQIRCGYRRLMAAVGDRRSVVVGPAPAPARAVGARRVDAILRAEAERSGTPYISMIGHRFAYLPGGLHLTVSGHRQFGVLVADRVALLSRARGAD